MPRHPDPHETRAREMCQEAETRSEPLCTIARQSRAERIELAATRLCAPVPSTKGMSPSDRAARLHSEMERRIALAKDALAYMPGDLAP